MGEWTSNLPFEVKKDFRIGANAWVADYDRLVEELTNYQMLLTPDYETLHKSYQPEIVEMLDNAQEQDLQEILHGVTTE